MKNLECRVWDAKNNVMIYSGRDIIFWRFDGSLTVELDGNAQILLYTGIKDKFGIKAYDMDIIETNGAVKVLVWHLGGIVAIDDRFIVGRNNKDHGFYFYEQLNSIKEFKILGNVFEHKFLLSMFK